MPPLRAAPHDDALVQAWHEELRAERHEKRGCESSASGLVGGEAWALGADGRMVWRAGPRASRPPRPRAQATSAGPGPEWRAVERRVERTRHAGADIVFFTKRPLDVPPRCGATTPLPPRSCRRGFGSWLRGAAAAAAHIRVTKDGTEVDSVPVSDKALLFGRKVTALPPAHWPSPSPLCAGARARARAHTHTHTWLQVKHAPKLGTCRSATCRSQEHASAARPRRAL